MPSFFYLANLANNLSILLVFTKNLNFYSINFLTSFFPQHYLGLFCSSFSICNLNAKLIIFQIYFLISVFRTIPFPWIWLQLCCCKYLYRMLSLLVTSVYFQISIDFLFNAWVIYSVILNFHKYGSFRVYIRLFIPKLIALLSENAVCLIMII